jgi:hypothetical protein
MRQYGISHLESVLPKALYKPDCGLVRKRVRRENDNHPPSYAESLTLIDQERKETRYLGRKAELGVRLSTHGEFYERLSDEASQNPPAKSVVGISKALKEVHLTGLGHDEAFELLAISLREDLDHG